MLSSVGARFDPRPHIDKRVRYLTTRQPLTVCIAAICDAKTEHPKIVFAADRLISAEIQFEHRPGKITQLSKYCCVMMSSDDALRSNMIVQRVLDQIQLAPKLPTIKEIAELFSKACIDEKSKNREHDVLGPLGLNHETFRKSSKDMPSEMVREITTALSYYRYRFESEFLILGIDMEPKPRAHIYTVDQDGKCTLHDFLGFAFIGIGRSLAFPELTKFPYAPNDIDWQQTMLRVYCAKRVAERIGGVGRQTDLFVLHVKEDENGVFVPMRWRVDKETRAVLDEGIRKLKKSELDTLNSVLHEVREKFAETKTEPTGSSTQEETEKETESQTSDSKTTFSS